LKIGSAIDHVHSLFYSVYRQTGRRASEENISRRIPAFSTEVSDSPR
jgi:hypothetical protein